MISGKSLISGGNVPRNPESQLINYQVGHVIELKTSLSEKCEWFKYEKQLLLFLQTKKIGNGK